MAATKLLQSSKKQTPNQCPWIDFENPSHTELRVCPHDADAECCVGHNTCCPSGYSCAGDRNTPLCTLGASTSGNTAYNAGREAAKSAVTNVPGPIPPTEPTIIMPSSQALDDAKLSLDQVAGTIALLTGGTAPTATDMAGADSLLTRLKEAAKGMQSILDAETTTGPDAQPLIQTTQKLKQARDELMYQIAVAQSKFGTNKDETVSGNDVVNKQLNEVGKMLKKCQEHVGTPTTAKEECDQAGNQLLKVQTDVFDAGRGKGNLVSIITAADVAEIRPRMDSLQKTLDKLQSQLADVLSKQQLSEMKNNGQSPAEAEAALEKAKVAQLLQGNDDNDLQRVNELMAKSGLSDNNTAGVAPRFEGPDGKPVNPIEDEKVQKWKEEQKNTQLDLDDEEKEGMDQKKANAGGNDPSQAQAYELKHRLEDAKGQEQLAMKAMEDHSGQVDTYRDEMLKREKDIRSQMKDRLKQANDAIRVQTLQKVAAAMARAKKNGMTIMLKNRNAITKGQGSPEEHALAPQLPSLGDPDEAPEQTIQV